jgi:glycosyltransferase involved in cell wall biosynthesis
MWRDAGRPTQAFDLVHATAFPYAFPIVCGLRLARSQGIPLVVTPFLHVGDPDDPQDRTRRSYLSPALLSLLREADCIFLQTEPEREALLGKGIPEGRMVLQGMGVEPAECTGGDRELARREWGVARGELVVGHLANNSVEKGTVDLLWAAEALWDRGRRFRVVLAGPEMPNFRRFWDGYRPAGRVRRLGVLDDRQKRDFFAGIDLFVLPSRSDSFGLVILEAWANGVPSVAYLAGGLPGVIRHEEDGLLVRCGNVDELAAALGRLIVDGGLRFQLGRTGRERISKDFRWEAKLKAVREVYQRLARLRGGLATTKDQ